MEEVRRLCQMKPLLDARSVSVNLDASETRPMVFQHIMHFPVVASRVPRVRFRIILFDVRAECPLLRVWAPAYTSVSKRTSSKSRR